MSEKLTQHEADYLAGFRDEPHLVSTVVGLDMVYKGYLKTFPKVNYFELTDTGRAALAEYEAAHASSRDDLARAMHDASTQDSDGLTWEDNQVADLLGKGSLLAAENERLKARIAELEALLREALWAIEPIASEKITIFGDGLRLAHFEALKKVEAKLRKALGGGE